MNEHVTEQPTYQPPLLHNWALYHREKHQADAIDAGIGAYEKRVADAIDAVRVVKAECQQRIADANQVYEQAKRAYAEQGRLHNQHAENAAMHRRMVERECRDLNLPLPPEPPAALPAADTSTRPQALPAGDGHVMAWQEAPRPDPLTDPLPAGAAPLHGQQQRPLHLLGLPVLAQCPACGDELVAPGGNGEELLHAATGHPQCQPDQAQARVDALALQQAQDAERGPEDGEEPVPGPFPPGAAQEGQAGD